MTDTAIDLDLKINASMPKKKDYGIGCIGAGFIMKDIQLVSYNQAGFNPVAIASRNPKHAMAAAKERRIPKVYETWQELLEDTKVEILDIAFPPNEQLRIIKEAVKQNNHIKGILAQKPLAMNYTEAKEIVSLCKNAGVKLSVNQNMRYDQSIKALKTILKRGYLGKPILATIEMRAIPHWQNFLKQYDRLTILNMSIHHIDTFRYLFGDPDKIIASARSDPRTKFKHIDGIAAYIFEYDNGFRAIGLDDVWAWPGKGTEPERDTYIKWRVEGLEGVAKGTIGWPYYPVLTPSTIDFSTKKYPGYWFKPRWKEVWFPDAFAGTMAQLLRAIEKDAEPEISATDNLKTMAAVDACYKSIKEGRAIELKEIIN
jgi:predicted dehydrogenase